MKLMPLLSLTSATLTSSSLRLHLSLPPPRPLSLVQPIIQTRFRRFIRAIILILVSIRQLRRIFTMATNKNVLDHHYLRMRVDRARWYELHSHLSAFLHKAITSATRFENSYLSYFLLIICITLATTQQQSQFSLEISRV